MTPKSARPLATVGLLTTTALVTGLMTAVPAGALEGDSLNDSAYAFAAQLNIGNAQKACSGALVAPQWVLTAASCFADGSAPVRAGAPKVKTTVTVGRTDLTQAGGSVQEAVELVPRADRDVVMVKLARRVQGVKPVTVASVAPGKGSAVRAAGFGRTADTWVPDQLHASSFTVAAVDATAMQLNGSGKAVLCQGDAGGPAVHEGVGGEPELISVNSRSWQGGCLDADPKETRTSAINTRVDDLGGWIRQVGSKVQDDFTSDGIADLAAIWGDGSMHIYPGDQDKGLAGRNTTQPGGTSWKSMKRIAKGDFNKDGNADIMAIWGDGSLHLYRGDGNGSISAGVAVPEGGGSWGTIKQLTAGDYTGDGVADLMAVWVDGTLHMYKGKGDGTVEAQRRVTVGGSTWGSVKLLPGGDFDGDGIADLMAVWSDGTLHFYKGKGDGQFADGKAVSVGGSTWGSIKHMTAGDYTGDGIADLMAIWGDGTLHVYRGDGRGGVTNGVAVAAGGNTWKTILNIA
ncbi:FG-GAP-like repeat-containing protein [Streptomyces violascens]|uniref:FG-GAP-like repeat-containing protein n=1 Tax=Streptomyces violascens TaxID=67381 RepID=UPI0036B31674